MQKIIDFLKGKKAYLIAAVIGILTIIIGIFHVQIPEYVWIGLGALGLGFIKASIPDTSNIQLTGLAQNIFATKWGKYLVPVLLGVGAAASAAGITIPEYIWTGLATIGLGSLRANIEVAKKALPTT